MSDDRFDRLTGIAEQREERLLGALGEIRRLVHDRELKIAQLRQFGDEYQARQAELGGGGTSVTMMRDYGRFISRLHDSINEQQGALEALRVEESRREAAWRDAMVERKRLATLAERRETERERRRGMAEQAAEDEAALHVRRLRADFAT